MSFRQVVVALLVLLVVVLMIQNAGVVSVRFLFWRVDMSLFILILLSALLGGVVGYFVKLRRPKKSTS